jgi:hypothetical protein
MNTLLLACSVCFGQSDSPLAQATNMGIFFMLGITVLMLGAFASFIFYLKRRSRLFDDGVLDSVPAHERTV